MNLKESKKHASSRAIAAAFAVWLVRNYGGDKSSELADIVVSTVQKLRRGDIDA
jgi:hypothetical protein